MRLAALALIALIALLHFYIAWFEIFAWTTMAKERRELLSRLRPRCRCICQHHRLLQIRPAANGTLRDCTRASQFK